MLLYLTLVDIKQRFHPQSDMKQKHQEGSWQMFYLFQFIAPNKLAKSPFILCVVSYMISTL